VFLGQSRLLERIVSTKKVENKYSRIRGEYVGGSVGEEKGCLPKQGSNLER
jgi:hypothetical protein